MTTDTPGGPKAAADGRPPNEGRKSNDGGSRPLPPAAATEGEKKLSGAELKALKKANKAASRAKAKEVVPPAAAAGPPSAQQQGGGDQKAQKGKAKQDGQHPPAGGNKALPVRPAAPHVAPKEEKKQPLIPPCFSHLTMARRIEITKADKDVHPAILALGQQMSALKLRESTARLEAMLIALKHVRHPSITSPRC